MNHLYKSYQRNSVTTASTGELTLMLYNTCLKFISLARKAIEENEIEQRNTNIQKAQNIISELMVALNMDLPVSKDLMALYDFINRQLIEANIKNNRVALDIAEELVVHFRDTWKQAIQMNRQKQFDNGGAI